MSRIIRSLILFALLIALPLPVSAQTTGLYHTLLSRKGLTRQRLLPGTMGESNIPPLPTASASFKGFPIKNMAWERTWGSAPIPTPVSRRPTPSTTSMLLLPEWAMRAAANVLTSISHFRPTPHWRSMLRTKCTVITIARRWATMNVPNLFRRPVTTRCILDSVHFPGELCVYVAYSTRMVPRDPGSCPIERPAVE